MAILSITKTAYCNVSLTRKVDKDNVILLYKRTSKGNITTTIRQEGGGPGYVIIPGGVEIGESISVNRVPPSQTPIDVY